MNPFRVKIFTVFFLLVFFNSLFKFSTRETTVKPHFTRKMPISTISKLPGQNLPGLRVPWGLTRVRITRTLVNGTILTWKSNVNLTHFGVLLTQIPVRPDEEMGQGACRPGFVGPDPTLVSSTILIQNQRQFDPFSGHSDPVSGSSRPINRSSSTGP